MLPPRPSNLTNLPYHPNRPYHPYHPYHPYRPYLPSCHTAAERQGLDSSSGSVMVFTHAAAHTSILTEAGARWAMALDVLVLLFGWVAVLLKMAERSETSERPNSQCSQAVPINPGHVSIAIEPGHVSTAIARQRSGDAGKTGTDAAAISHPRPRLTSRSGTRPSSRSGTATRPGFKASSQLRISPRHRSGAVLHRPRRPSQKRVGTSVSTKSSPPSQGGVAASSPTGWVWTSVFPLVQSCLRRLKPDRDSGTSQNSHPRSGSSSQLHKHPRHLHGALLLLVPPSRPLRLPLCVLCGKDPLNHKERKVRYASQQ